MCIWTCYVVRFLLFKQNTAYDVHIRSGISDVCSSDLPYPGVPTLVTNVTIYDGEGGRNDNGSVLFADGKIVELGQTVAAPEGATVIDGTGKWVTPGIIEDRKSVV